MYGLRWLQIGRCGELAERLSSRPTVACVVTRMVLGRVLTIRQTGDVLMGGASGAGSLLLNTKASQEAACSQAPAAIAPGQEPEPRDAGVSRFAGIGSHPEGADTAEGHAGQVERSGMSGNAGTGSHPAATPVTDAVGVQVGGSGGSELTKNGSHLVAAVFSDKPRRSYDGGPQRAVQNQAFWCTECHRKTVPYRIRPPAVRDTSAERFGTTEVPQCSLR